MKSRYSHEKSTGGTGLMERMRRGVSTRLGKAVLGTTLALGVAGGVAEVAHNVSQQNAAEFKATQEQISPIIKQTMIDIDMQTLAKESEKPDEIIRIDNPDGRNDAFKFINATGNTVVVMGKTEDGRPDPLKPMFIRYNNNTGTGEGTRGIRVIMTAPEGNHWVDQDPWIGLGGTTDGGWGAAVPGSCDTTYRGYADHMPAPLDAAQEVAEIAQQFGPYDPYILSQPK